MVKRLWGTIERARRSMMWCPVFYHSSKGESVKLVDAPLFLACITVASLQMLVIPAKIVFGTAGSNYYLINIVMESFMLSMSSN